MGGDGAGEFEAALERGFGDRVVQGGVFVGGAGRVGSGEVLVGGWSCGRNLRGVLWLTPVHAGSIDALCRGRL